MPRRPWRASSRGPSARRRRFPGVYAVDRDEVYEDHAWHFGQGPKVGRALKYLLDTNVLVYALEHGEPRKREWAVEVIRRLGRAGGRHVASSGLMAVPRPCMRKLEPRPDAETVRAEVLSV